MTEFDILKSHIGHKVVVVGYGQDEIVNVSIECEDCNEVLYSIDKFKEEYKMDIGVIKMSVNKSREAELLNNCFGYLSELIKGEELKRVLINSIGMTETEIEQYGFDFN